MRGDGAERSPSERAGAVWGCQTMANKVLGSDRVEGLGDTGDKNGLMG